MGSTKPGETENRDHYDFYSTSDMGMVASDSA